MPTSIKELYHTQVAAGTLIISQAVSLLTSDQVSAPAPAAWCPLIGVLSVGLPIVLHQLL